MQLDGEGRAFLNFGSTFDDLPPNPHHRKATLECFARVHGLHRGFDSSELLSLPLDPLTQVLLKSFTQVIQRSRGQMKLLSRLNA